MIGRPVTIDASTLLNLLATGAVESILHSMRVDKFVCSAVAEEVLYLRSVDPDGAPEPVSIVPLIASGLLKKAKLESSGEEAQFVNFAATLDDGEAMSLAICASRGYVLATDDRKARRVAEEQSPPVSLLATSELIAEWSESNSIGSNRIQEVLTAVGRRARFGPWQDYPLREWWIDILKGSK